MLKIFSCLYQLYSQNWCDVLPELHESKKCVKSLIVMLLYLTGVILPLSYTIAVYY